MNVTANMNLTANWVVFVLYCIAMLTIGWTGEAARVIPLSMQDLTPIDNGVHHLNGLGELPEGTTAPCLGVGLTSILPVSGAASGVTTPCALEAAVRFVVEIAKYFARGKFHFYDEAEFDVLKRRYGSMAHLFTHGNA